MLGPLLVPVRIGRVSLLGVIASSCGHDVLDAVVDESLCGESVRGVSPMHLVFEDRHAGDPVQSFAWFLVFLATIETREILMAVGAVATWLLRMIDLGSNHLILRVSFRSWSVRRAFA